jgi:uncharacterized protein YaeQ
LLPGLQYLGRRITLALKSTIFKIALQVTNIDRNYYQSHALTLARHPSETDERLMMRLLAFALHASDALQFGKGLSSDEPDLWRRDLTGQSELWIAIGQPDEQAIRRACGKAQQVVVYTYSGTSAQHWWDKSRDTLVRSRNLTVIDIDSNDSKSLAALAQRGMDLQCFVQDGQIQMMSDTATVPVKMSERLGARA